MTNELLIVFTRNPELGKVKTRLAKTIGDQAALNIYMHLLEHTENTIRKIRCDKAVYYTLQIRNNDIWDNAIYQKHLQEGEDLGLRMQNAFSSAFIKGYEKVIIVGSDLLDLNANYISEAFNSLNKNDVVIGPAQDGGYYLIGMKSLYSNIFKNKDWGTDSVFQDTINDLKNLDIYLLEELNDIDTFEDIKDNPYFKKMMNSND